jgi:hypothetical protein
MWFIDRDGESFCTVLADDITQAQAICDAMNKADVRKEA